MTAAPTTRPGRALFLATAAAGILSASAQPDRFNYYGTVQRPGDGGMDYGLEDWGQIQCDHNDLTNCIGYTSDWKHAVDWKVRENSCDWCPDDEIGNNRPGCQPHHQSPAFLDREIAINGTQFANYCIDIHWMQYGDSTCEWDILVEKQAFTVERHALRIAQPLFRSGFRYLPDCLVQGRGRIWGRIDFSRGFPAWWYLSHIDFHVPSEHVQNGKRYSGEMHMYHFYSKPVPEDNPNRNELASVSVFLEEYEDSAPWDYLERLICQWRLDEERTRLACGLPQIKPAYPGCFEPDRNAATQRGGRSLRTATGRKLEEEYLTRNKKTAMDVVLSNRIKIADAEVNGNLTALDHLETLVISEADQRPPDDIDWESFIAEQSASMQRKQDLYSHVHKSNKTEAEEYDVHNRNLLAGESLFWLNHFPLIGCKTEYYFRYEGAMTTPPCYGPETYGGRANTTHYRVMKDPVRIHPRQLREMKRLIADRVAPPNDPVESVRCKADTAAKVTRNSNNEAVDVSVARPIQARHYQHKMMFCECERWPSKWPEDRDWCREDDQRERFFGDNPYNYDTPDF